MRVDCKETRGGATNIANTNFMVPIIDCINSIKDNAHFFSKASAPTEFGLEWEINS